MDKALKAICAIGFCIGACVGALLYAGTGMAGLAAAIVCGGIGALALPVGLGVLALIGFGIAALGSYVYNKCCHSKTMDDEKQPLLANTHANEQNAKLVSTLQASPASSPKHSPKQTIENVQPIATQPKTENKKGFFSSIFCCFSSKKKPQVAPTVQADVTNRAVIR